MDVLSSRKSGNTTVTFDVGGKLYKVSRSLLEQYPDTMLARLASDTWSPDSSGRDDYSDSEDEDYEDDSEDDGDDEDEDDYEDEDEDEGEGEEDDVTFDVGGKLYKVSRSLLEQYTYTIAAQLPWSPGGNTSSKNAASSEDPKKSGDEDPKKSDSDDDRDIDSEDEVDDEDDCDDNCDDDGDGEEDDVDEDGTTTIGTDGDSNNAALFIERDGERFRYCLDYMRDGKVVGLPPTISKDALLQDLAYYGFHDVDSSRISIKRSLSMIQTCHQYIESLDKKLDDELKRHDESRKALELVKYILRHYKERGSLTIGISGSHKLFYAAEDTRGIRKEFISYLKMIGFKFEREERQNRRIEFHLEYL